MSLNQELFPIPLDSGVVAGAKMISGATRGLIGRLADSIVTQSAESLAKTFDANKTQLVDQCNTMAQDFLKSEAGRTAMTALRAEVISGIKDILRDPEYVKETHLCRTLTTCGHTLTKGLVMSYVLEDWRGVAVTLAFAICDILQLPAVISGAIVLAFTKLSISVAIKHPAALKVEGPDDITDIVSETLAAIWQALSVVFSITERKPRCFKDWTLTCVESVGKQCGKTKDYLKFFSTIAKVVYRMYCWVANKAFGLTIGSQLLYQDSALIGRWTDEVLILLRPENESKVINDAAWYQRVVAADMLGTHFAVEINRAGVKDSPPFMRKYLDKISQLHLRAMHQGVATAFRPEPVSIWVAGPAGLGKTFVKDEVINTLLQAMGVPCSGNDVFTMNVAQKYWTGAEHKKVIYYDDFGTVDSGEILPETIGQFMQLISDSRFAPPQAECEDKDKVVAPVLVYVNANEVCPTYNATRDQVAFARRRHFCIEVQPSPDFTQRFGPGSNLETEGAIGWLKRHQTETNKAPHALFFFVDPQTGKRTSDKVSYEAMMSILVPKVVSRYFESKDKHIRKMASLTSLSDAECGAPLESIVEEVQKRAREAASSAGYGSRLEEIYDASLSSLKDAAALARDWLKSFTGSVMSTEGNKECTCHPYIVHQFTLEETAEGVKLCRHDPVLGSSFYEPKYCDANPCRQGTLAWRMNFLKISPNPAIRAVAEKYVSMLPSLPVGVPVTNTSEPPQYDDLNAIGQQNNVPRKELPQWVKSTAVGLLALGIAIAGCTCVKAFFQNKTIKLGTPVRSSSRDWTGHSELISSGDNHQPRLPSVKGIAVRRLVPKTELVDGPLLTEGALGFHALVDRNICFIYLHGVDRSSQTPFKGFTMRCFGICGNYLLVLKHYVAKIQRTDNHQLEFVNSAATVQLSFTLDDCKIIEYCDSEYVLMKLPSRIPQFRDVRAHIMTEEQSGKLLSKGYVYEKALGQPPVKHMVRLSVDNRVRYADGDVCMEIPTGISYNWHAPGRCMTPVISTFTKEMIVGFHICGGDGKGVAEPIIRENFEGLLNVLNIEMPQPEIIAENGRPSIVLDANLVAEGVTRPRYAAHPAEKTSIEKSLIHGYVPATTRPAPLTQEQVEGKFSPLISGCVKHGQPPKGFNPKLLARAKEYLREQYLVNCKPVRATVDVLTVSESVLGFEGIDGYQSMELSTSEGFPYTATRPQGETNKRYLFDIRETPQGRRLFGLDRALESRMDRNEALRRAGVVPFTVFTDCLKDSRIANEKYLVPGKTRIFSISPADFTIQFRQYFLDILAAQKVNRLNLEHAVGINVFSLEWTQLTRLLQSKGEKVLCGDYSNFGPGLDSEVVAAVGEVWCDWYATHEEAQGLSQAQIDSNRLVRTCFFEEMRHAVHQACNVLYRAPCGSPSGAPPTVNVNNDVNKMYIYMAWMKCWEDHPIMNTLVAFRKHVSMFVYGDDLIANVSDVAVERFNNEFLHSFFKEHGIRYTDDTKGDTIRKYTLLNEAGFLKNSFVPSHERPGFFNAALSKKSIEDCANWVRKSGDKQAATKQVICDSLMLAYGWGREYFNIHRTRLMLAWESVSQEEDLVLYTYDEMDAMRYGSVESDVSCGIDELVEKERKWREQLARELDIAEGTINIMGTEAFPDGSRPTSEQRRAFKSFITKARQLRKLGVIVPSVERHAALMEIWLQ